MQLNINGSQIFYPWPHLRRGGSNLAFHDGSARFVQDKNTQYQVVTYWAGRLRW